MSGEGHKEDRYPEEAVMKKSGLAFLAAVVLVALGCTITTRHTIEAHITVDIRHIEQQADDVLDYIEGKTEALPGLESAAGAEGQSWLHRVIEPFAPMRTVCAAETTLKDSSALVNQIASRMRERNVALEALKALGCVGENNRGYAELRPSDTLTDPEKINEAQRVVAEETKDRKALYKEIVRLNSDVGADVSTVEQIYADKRLERAKSGEIFQLPPAGERLEAFKRTGLGKKLGDACVADAWVKIP